MAFDYQISLGSHPHKQRLQLQVLGGACSGYCGHGSALSTSVLLRRKCLRFRSLEVKAVSSRAEGGSRRSAASRRVYRQSQSESSLTLAPVKQFASYVAPAGMFLAVTFGINFGLNFFFSVLAFFFLRGKPGNSKQFGKKVNIFNLIKLSYQ